MTRCSLFFLSFLLCASLFAQNHPTCNTQRYRLDVFSDISVTKDVKYGEGQTIGGADVELFMDIYEPTEESVGPRPMVMLAFGGSFITGSRRDMQFLCERYARKGYVAVTIDYRLYDLPLIPLPTEGEMQDVVVKAIKDMKTALQFLDENVKSENTYGIDMDWAYVGGISAGAIVASHTAMLDSTDVFSTDIQTAIDSNAPIDGVSNSNNTVQIKGVINYSGALSNVGWIDANDPPFISYHESGDPTVPYKDGSAQIFGQDIISLSGSYSMDSAASSVGVSSVLNTIDANTHVGYFLNPEKATEVIDESAFWMYEMICSETASLEYIIPIDVFSVSPNPFNNELTVAIQSEKGAELQIMDTQGKVVLERQLSTGSQSIETSKLATGIYFLQLDINGQLVTKKLIKQ